jgi:hypothetical protein
MKIVRTGQLEWPPPYKSATEKYSPQVKLNDQESWKTVLQAFPFRYWIPTIRATHSVSRPTISRLKP